MDINKIVETHVKNELESISVNGVVHDIIKGMISSEIKSSISNIVKDELKTVISKQVKTVFEGESIVTDDGWGKREEYANFGEMFKREMRNKLNNHYEAKKIVQKTVKEMVDKIYSQESESFFSTFKDYLKEKQILTTGENN